MSRNQIFISDYYRGLFENIKKQILNEKDEYVIQTNLDELIEFDKKRQEDFEHKKEPQADLHTTYKVIRRGAATS